MVGSAKLCVLDGNRKSTAVKLKNVSYVPGLKANLVSVSAISMKGFDVIFKASYVLCHER